MRHDHFSMLPERAFRSLGGRMTLEGGGKGSSAPPAPDYTGAAQQQAQSSVETTNMANYANRPTMNTPFGSQSWTTKATIDPATGQAVTNWTQNTTLTPKSQEALDSQLAMQQGRSDIANRLMPQAESAVNTPIDYSSFSKAGTTPTQSNFQSAAAAPTLQNIGSTPSFTNASNGPTFDTLGTSPTLNTDFTQKSPEYNQAYVQDLQNQALNYMRPDQEHQSELMASKLANQGITAGSEAYNNAMRQMSDQQARDKYQALNTAMSQGSQMYNNQLAGNAQNMQAMNFGNAALGQQQGLDQNVASFNNAAAQNQYSNANQANQYNNQLAQNVFANQNTAAQFNNTNAQNNFANAQTAATFNNQNLQNQFAQQQNIANYQNQLRQQQISEAQQRQLQPLNNINALMTGQQVGMPQMPSFNANQAAQPVNYLGAAQSAGNYGMQQAQMNNASSNSATSGAFQLGGAALGAAMMMSDKRLKTNVQKVMDIKVNGKTLGWYRYQYLGSSCWYEGVMAQEVKKEIPEAVKRHHSGFDMVDYAQLGVA